MVPPQALLGGMRSLAIRLASRALVEVAPHPRGHGGPDDCGQLRLARAAHAPERAEGREQLPPLGRADPGNVVEGGVQRPLRARLAVKADGEPVRLVPDPLDELKDR